MHIQSHSYELHATENQTSDRLYSEASELLGWDIGYLNEVTSGFTQFLQVNVRIVPQLLSQPFPSKPSATQHSSITYHLILHTLQSWQNLKKQPASVPQSVK
jgi:hypothetical protein